MWSIGGMSVLVGRQVQVCVEEEREVVVDRVV